MRDAPQMRNARKHGDPVVRDASWINREYGHDKWPVVLERINRSIAAGERSLSRLVASLVRWEWESPDLRPVTAVAFGKQVQLPASLAWHGFYALVAEAVISACRDDTQAVIDLGCGWGRSLFETWLRGGPRASAYYALEFTQAGLDCVSALAALEPLMPIRTSRFDFQAPNLSSLPRPLAHAVVFTVSSVHQVPLVDIDSFRALLGIADSIDCLHFEQIGWQIDPGSGSHADREYAVRNDYNRNLWEVLTHLETSREIALVDVRADLFGAQSLYPMSLVHWRRARG
jgi:hypothetical protein